MSDHLAVSTGRVRSNERKIDRALGAILRLLQAAHPVVIAYSGGKDSSVVVALVLHAALGFSYHCLLSLQEGPNPRGLAKQEHW